MLLSRLCLVSEYALLVPYSMSFLLLFKELQTPSQKKLLVKVGRINREAIVCSLNGADSCFLFWLAGSEEEIAGFQSLFLPVALLHFIWPSSFRLAIAILNSAPLLFLNTLWAIVSGSCLIFAINWQFGSFHSITNIFIAILEKG